MARVKRAVNAQKKRRTTLARAEGYRGQRSRLYRKAKEQVTHSLGYAYRDRKARKGEPRRPRRFRPAVPSGTPRRRIGTSGAGAGANAAGRRESGSR